MIRLCELVCQGAEHVPLNASMVEIVRRAYPDVNVEFWGDRNHVLLVKDQLASSVAASISWHSVKLPKRHVGSYQRVPREVKILTRALYGLSDHETGELLLTSVLPSTLLSWMMLSRINGRRTPVRAVLHGNASELPLRASRNPFRRMWNIRLVLKRSAGEGLRYLALEECTRNAILKCVPSLAARIDVLEHPIPANEGDFRVLDLSVPIRFGFLGVANEQKGFPQFLALATMLRGRYQGLVEFHAIGNCPDKRFSERLDALTTKPGTELLGRRDYTDKLRQLHYLVFPYSRAHYEYSPSGALLDAIAWRKPFISSDLPIFAGLIARHGDIGYTGADAREIEGIVSRIVEAVDGIRYRVQVLNLEKARSARTPAFLSKRYRELRQAVTEKVALAR